MSPDAGSDGDYLPDSSPKKKPKPKTRKIAPMRRRLHRGRNPDPPRTPSPTEATPTPEKITQPASNPSHKSTTPIPPIQYEDPPSSISSSASSSCSIERFAIAWRALRPAARAGGSSYWIGGIGVVDLWEGLLAGCVILDERGKKYYLAKWEPNWVC